MLAMNKVTSYYGKTPILQNIDLEIGDGKCVCVLGRNGVGKTTLMQTIMGLTTRMTGDLSINGISMGKAITAKRAIAGLGYVPQGRRIFGKFSVRDNIRLGTFAREDGNESIPEICLELFPYLADNLDKRAGMLSGGQQQQLAIARALATDPKILLLDEPTEGIQPSICDEIIEVLIRLRKERNLSIILVEQDIDFLWSICDRILAVDKGSVVRTIDPKGEGSTEEAKAFIGIEG